ncbi:MAG: 4'-phosphopantetheinyl transferase superfamily protein [Deltaproteobacteria bacterium]|nr:MAG: 4'-phosphopantetheinyl transferase superfamily protein [Deltaproteobacteria bacterium]
MNHKALYQPLYHHATPHGVLTAVALPPEPKPVPTSILDQLAEEEAAHAADLRGFRQVQFVGGRLALRHAAAQLGMRLPAAMPDDRGAPVMPPRIVGSVSHKHSIAVGMVARSNGRTLGVDIEEYEPARMGIAPKILRPEELATIEAMPEENRWLALLLRFSIKESIYKALDPYVRRYVGFHEAFVEPDLEGGARVELHLANGETGFEVDARYAWLEGRVLTSVRIGRTQPSSDS